MSDSNVVKFCTDDQRSVDEVLDWATEQEFDTVLVIGMNGEQNSARYSTSKDMIEMLGFMDAIKLDINLQVLRTLKNL